jgi:tetratricopeptide (TPR) repeat protein
MLAIAAPSVTAARGADQNVPLPDLPQIVLEHFLPGIRDKVQDAYNAAKANPHDALLNGRLGMVLQASDQADEWAEACYRRAHLLDPTSFRWVYYLGIVLANRGEYDEAAATLRDALRVDPEYLPARLNLGECLLASGKWQLAAELFEALVRKNPDSPHAHYGLARVRAARNDLNGAAESFRKACELSTNFGAAHYGLARVYERLGRKDRSMEQMKLYDSTKGSAPELKDQLLAQVTPQGALPSDEFRRGMELAEQGKVQEAAAEYEKALEFNPELEKAHVNLISLYGRLGQAAKAEEHFQAAVRLDPNDPDCYFNHGLLLASEERYSEAEQAFRKALESNPHYPEAHTNLGYMLEAQGNLTEAVSAYKKAIADIPDDAQANFALGRIAVNQDNYQEGVGHFLLCLRTGSGENRPAYLYALGAAYARAGDRKNGLQYLRKAREEAVARSQRKLAEAIDEDLKHLQEEPGQE